MHENPPIALEPARRSSRCRTVLAGLLILVLPPVLSIVGYDRPALIGDPLFYGYQLKRAGELNGCWWQVGQDPLLGQPYQNEIAKHAGLYEGVDLMLACAWPSHYLDATQAYYFAAYLALAFNGWVAGALAFRFTRSLLWTAVAIVLITWNAATVDRMVYHLHLIKYGWALLAIGAFFDYLQKPNLRRGAWLGAVVALVLQGSFYFGYFVLLALATWWVGCLIARKLERAHLGPTCVAGMTFAAAGFALTFPVWMIARSRLFADDYFHRPWNETWVYGSELWQYFTPQRSQRALEFIAQVGAKPLVTYSEGWNFPGFTILVAVGFYLFARLRGWKLWPANAPFINLLLGLMGVFVLLSLAGGPSFFLFEVPALSCFRSYGRTGLLALAAGCVAAPLILQGLIAALRPRGLKAAALAAVLALIACDARHALRTPDRPLARYRQVAARSFPGWVDWLRVQPESVRMAAFSPSTREAPITWWGFDSLRYRLRHGHATLNGCEFRLLEGDLRLVGASYDHMNAAGLRLIVGLGYEALAFDEAYLKANPWITSLPWLDWVEHRGTWRIARAGGALARLPRRTLEQLLAAQPEPLGQAVADVPPQTWITGQLVLDRDVVVPDDSRVLMTWCDSRGRLIGKPVEALFQHVFGPSIPAYRILTPRHPGDHDLVFLDRQQRRLASQPYRVTAAVPTARRKFAGRERAIAVNRATAETVAAGPDSLVITLENASPHYLQTVTEHPGTCPSIMAHPGLVYPGTGSLGVWIQLDAADGRPAQDLNFLLPHDLGPQGKLTLELPADRFPGAGERVRYTVTPNLGLLGLWTDQAAAADVRLSLTAKPGSPLAGPGVAPVLTRSAQPRLFPTASDVRKARS